MFCKDELQVISDIQEYREGIADSINGDVGLLGHFSTVLAKTESTNFAHFCSSHYPTLRCWQHLVGISEDAVYRLCGE